MGGSPSPARGYVELSTNGLALTYTESDSIELSIVLPAYNESGRIRKGLGILLASIECGELGTFSIEVLVVDDGSTDDTAAQAERLLSPFAHSSVIRLPKNVGKGAAIRAGVAQARGAIVAFMDVDMAVHPSQLPSLLTALEDADVAIGSRALPESKTQYGSPLRVVMGRSFTRIVRATTHLPLHDTQCGFKAYPAPVARLLFHCSTIDRFAFDVEILTIARQLGLRLAEVPVHWCHQPDSRIRPFVDSVPMVCDVIRTRRGLRGGVRLHGAVAQNVSKGTSAVEATHTALGPTMPVVSWEDGSALALFPLCGTSKSQCLIGKLQEAMPEASVRPLSLTLAQFVAIAPLLFARIGAPIAHAPAMGADRPGPMRLRSS